MQRIRCSEYFSAAAEKCSLSVEIVFAKETKNCLRPLRKTPRLNTSEGLQYGLSGNQVIQSATLYPAFLRETAPPATGSKAGGNLLDLSRKIYFGRCHQF